MQDESTTILQKESFVPKTGSPALALRVFHFVFVFFHTLYRKQRLLNDENRIISE